MKNIKIKNRFNETVILCGRYESIKECLEKNRNAYLRGAYLRGADLRGAYLRGADLGGAYLRGAYLRGADLRGADLGGAYLEGADLEGADLRGAYFYGEKLTKTPIQILGLRYFILITKEQIKIGCKIHKSIEWENFTDKEVLEMGGKDGLDWWKQNKTLILKFQKQHAE